MSNKDEYAKAYDIVFKKIRYDRSLYRAWVESISKQYQDAMVDEGYRFPGLRKMADTAARNFIALTIGKIRE